MRYALILIGIAFLTYVNMLGNSLFYDDEELIYKNQYVADLSYFPKYFTTNMVEGAGKVSNMYRPLLITSFAVDHAVWGKNPVGYHLTSLLLHAANGILIFLLLRSLFQHSAAALGTSILFIIHPVQTEAVAYASGRTDLLYSLFSLASLLVFLRFNGMKSKNSLLFLVSFLLFTFALLSKETAIILPFLLSLFIAHGMKKKYAELLWTVPFWLMGIIYIFLRMTVLNFSNTLNFYQSSTAYSENIFIRIFTFMRVCFDYLSVLFFPRDLIFSRDAEQIASVLNMWVLLFIIACTVFIFFAWKYRKTHPVYLFSFFWFFLTLAPASGIIPINSIVAEHYLYLPSVGFFLTVSYSGFLLWKRLKSAPARRVLTVVCFLLFVLLGVRTIIRNMDWKDPVTFYTRSLAQSPDNLAMRNNLAMTYAEQGNLTLAIEQYQELIRKADVYPNTHHNLANAYKSQKKYKEAEEEYKKAIALDPDFVFSYAALADLYQLTNETEKFDEMVRIMNAKKIRF